MLSLLLVGLLSSTKFTGVSSTTVDSPNECRFAHQHSTDEILHYPDSFISDMFHWEGGYHQAGIAYNVHNGMTYDHATLDPATGLFKDNSGWSSPRNEAYHIMLLAHAINGSHLAQTFVFPSASPSAPVLAAAILKLKLQTYLKFNETYPGFAGFLPSFIVGDQSIWPSTFQNDRSTDFGLVKASDNAQLLWAVYGMAVMLRQSTNVELLQLSRGWLRWLSFATINVKGVFLHGPREGEICAATTLKPGVYPYATRQKYACESNNQLENNPYEGELMAWYLHFSLLYNNYLTQRNSTVVDSMWLRKRSQLTAINYTGSLADGSSPLHGAQNYTMQAIHGRHIKPITVQKGKYFGSNEQIKLLYLPYLDVPIVRQVFQNAETVRTCNSLLMEKTPGMFAVTSDPTSNANLSSDLDLRIVNAGIPSVSLVKEQNLDVITPYAVFPTILFDRWNGLTWYKSMLDGPKMQSVYGSTAAIRRDASSVANVVSWETKAPTLLALLGGIVGWVREGLNISGIYQDFYEISNREYGLKFNGTPAASTSRLLGQDIPFCLPNAQFPASSLRDYSSCTV